MTRSSSSKRSRITSSADCHRAKPRSKRWRKSAAGHRDRARPGGRVYSDRVRPGITGRFYQQFAVTIAVSVAISAFNALTLSPALSALLVEAEEKRPRPPLSLPSFSSRFCFTSSRGSWAKRRKRRRPSQRLPNCSQRPCRPSSRARLSGVGHTSTSHPRKWAHN
jgi:hypothetical protein